MSPLGCQFHSSSTRDRVLASGRPPAVAAPAFLDLLEGGRECHLQGEVEVVPRAIGLRAAFDGERAATTSLDLELDHMRVMAGVVVGQRVDHHATPPHVAAVSVELAGK